jgi:tetratricopeptide (TPR) repeat protein
VFGAGPARDAYLSLRARSDPMLVFRSAQPELLALPWELLRDPARPVPLALDLAGISRSLPAAPGTQAVPVPGGKLRVLMVIARPGGERDIGYQIIARPLLDRLHAICGRVELTVLRPPTLDKLTAVLAEAADQGAPYHVVHFDGHGSHNDSGQFASTTGLFSRRSDEAVLVFEKPQGGPDAVPASVVARALNQAKVPVVVLNACQSGAIGTDTGAAIATRLLAEGTASVVAMAYSVYAVAAAEFMAAFYERLFAGDPISAAVTAGRQRMYTHDARPSRKGDLPLADWLIPVHYLRRDVSFPQAVTTRTGPLSLDAELDQILAAETAGQGTADLEPAGVFIGRDWLTCQLETAARLQNVIVLHGPGGTGKTEMAKAFGRWWRDTGGVDQPEHVFFHSFEPGVATFGLDGVVGRIGRQLFAADFDRLDAGRRRAVVEKVLTERRMLLIWDHFETVRAMPDPDGLTELLDEDGCVALRAFLGTLARGNSAVLITSRSPEDWLGGVRRITVAGLTPPEANQYADYLLHPYPAARARRRKPAFGELMQWLDGHPLSMRLILPHLDTTDPASLLDALRGAGPLPGTGDGDRLSSLSACIAYSYMHLSPRSRRMLAAISLVQGVADAGMLAEFSGVRGVPERFRRARQRDWLRALNEAAGVGLLTELVPDAGQYRIHPALPAYLADRWRDEAGPGTYTAERDAATRALVGACALVSHWIGRQISSADPAFGYEIAGLHRRTLNSMLGYALQHELWDEAYAMLEPLSVYWISSGLTDEFDAWYDKVRLATEGDSGLLPEPASSAGRLWLAVVGGQLLRQQETLQLDHAEQTADRLRTVIESLPASAARDSRLANCYLQTGTIAQHRGHFDEADRWYGKALAIAEANGDKLHLAIAYHQLGDSAQEQGRTGIAESRLRSALAIEQELASHHDMASTYDRLGTIAHQRGHLDDAEGWLRKSLAICMEIGYARGVGNACSHLGGVAHDRGQLGKAEEWHRRALAIAEESGDRADIARSFHMLGMLAHERGELDVAGGWYRKALGLQEETGDVSQLPKTLVLLGVLAAQGNDARQALDWMIRSVALFDEYPHPFSGAGPEHLAELTRVLGLPVLEEAWRQLTGNDLPQAVRDHVATAVPNDLERSSIDGG